MADQFMDLIGNWTEFIGATIAAIGETKQLGGQHELGYRIGRVGNVTQGVGNALQAIAEDEDENVILGNWIQFAGTNTNAVAETLYLQGKEDIESKTIELSGDVMQSLGSFITALQRVDSIKRVLGNLVQSLGAGLEGIGIIVGLADQEQAGQVIETIGSWLQSFGTLYQSVGATRQFLNPT